MEGERQPGIDCLRMHNHNLGIHLRLEIVGKINMYTSDTRLASSKDTAVCQLNYLQPMNIENN